MTPAGAGPPDSGASAPPPAWGVRRPGTADRPGITAVVGMTLAYVDGVDELHHVLVLSPLAVDPLWQGHGLGKALVRAALADAREAGWPLVFLEGAPRVPGDQRRTGLPGSVLGYGHHRAARADPAPALPRDLQRR